MKLCRFKTQDGEIKPGLITTDSFILDLAAAGITSCAQLLELPAPAATVSNLALQNLPRLPIAEITLCRPIEDQEVWAAGVTYQRSKAARMEESNFSATAYDRVYTAERPELFFKSLPDKVVAHGEPVGIRRDARWSVPEPELALVLNSRGQLVGFTIGNDMSSRDIEGENLLYLPQAKIYRGSCSLGPGILLGKSEAEARTWTIQLEIHRGANTVFSEETTVDRIRRSFSELSEYLFRSQIFPAGAVLLTGTGIVPPDSFSLQGGDVVEIEISGIGRLRNPVIEV
jgi:2-dehydro-3-deoxy-D-arabinonate dehydratase